ncbi:hypothetical protein ACHAW6_011510 [Cyclotella cf. meneghiniana]
MRSHGLRISFVVVLLLVTPSQAEPHGRSSCARLESLCALRGGVWWAPRSREVTEREEDDEWEYYEDDEEGDDGDSDEYEYEYEGDDSGYYDYGKVQDIDGEFLSDGDAVESTEQRGEIDAQDQSVHDEQTVSEEYESVSESREAEEFLLDTPIANDMEIKRHDESTSNRFSPPRRNAHARAQSTTSLYDSNLASSTKTKQSKSWWSAAKPQSKDANRRQRKTSNNDILPSNSASSSGASFIYSPLVYKLSSIVRDVSTASSVHARSIGERRKRDIISRCINMFNSVASSILQPILRFIQALADTSKALAVQSLSVVMALVRRSIDALWYGPVEGVTTTGIARTGGLGSLLASSSFVVRIASSMLIVGFITLLVRHQQQHRGMLPDGGESRHNEFGKAFRGWRRHAQNNGISKEIDDDQEEYYDSEPDSNESPTAEEELEFFHSLDAANPISRQNGSKKITGKRRIWPFHKTQTTSRQSQRQRSVKSIQHWWRQRPSSVVDIIEPQQQPPPSQQIYRLQHQLAQSEQEREVLRIDVQRLQHRLQRAHHDARAIIEKNKWLESQQAKADSILTRAIEVERRKANSELERVRDTMKDVLQRERMLMRGRLADTLNAKRLQHEDDTEKNNATHVEGKAHGLIEGTVTSPVEQAAMDSDGYYDEDSIWGRRQRYLRKNRNGGNEGTGATPTITGNQSALSRRPNSFTPV